MKKRTIGRTGIEVAPLALGGNVFGWTIDRKRSFEVLDRFIDAGFNLIDTADVYSRWAGKGGESETIIGEWFRLRKNRHRVVLATKVGMDMGTGGGLAEDYVLKAAEDSLRRLQTDYIDLYQSHKDDLSKPVEEPLRAYGRLISAGKVKYVGASNFTPPRLRQALASALSGLPRYECLQPHYNLCERRTFEEELQALCEKESLGVIPYYSLAAGFLTGKYRTAGDGDKSVRGRGALRYLDSRGLKILEALDDIAASHKCRQAGVAIAWLLAKPAITAPIASATSTQQLEDLLTGARLELSEAEISQLDAASHLEKS